MTVCQVLLLVGERPEFAERQNAPGLALCHGGHNCAFGLPTYFKFTVIFCVWCSGEHL